MNSERRRIWIGYVVVSTVWGSTWLAIKVGLERIPPLFAAGARFVVASALLFVILRMKRIPVPRTSNARKLYATLVILSYTIPFALVYWGQQFIASGLSSILFAAYPFWVALFSQLVLKDEPVNAFKVGGMLLGFFGLVIIFAEDLDWTGQFAFAGMAAIVMSSVLQALALVLIKKYGQPINPFAMNFVGMSLGAAGLLGLSWITESWSGMVLDLTAVGSVLYLAVVGSVLAFVTYHWLLKRTDAVYLSLVSFINPIVAVILGAVVLHEELGGTVFAGAVLVFAGILLANGKYMYEKIIQTA